MIIRLKNIRIKDLLLIPIAIVLICILSSIPTDLDNSIRIKCAMLTFLYVFYIVLWIKYTHTVKSLFFFFLCYTALSNAGQLILYAFHIDIIASFKFFDVATKPVLNKALDYQALCTIFMCSFAIFSNKCFALSPESKMHVINNKPADFKDKYVSFPDLVYILSGFLFCVFNVLRLGSRMNSVYLTSFNRGDAVTAPFLVVMTFYVSMYYACYAHRFQEDNFKKYIVAVNAIVGVTNLLYGSRNVLIPLVFGMIYMWRFELKNVSLSKKIGIGVCGLLLLYILGSFVNIRRMALSDLTFEIIVDSLFGVGLFDQISMLVAEMGGSLRVLTTTISAIDSGLVTGEQTLLYTLLKSIVPKVDLLELIGIHEPRRWELSAWITDAFGNNAGWGYSMYAESYYNFKEAGYLFMGGFGFLYVWLENKIEKWYVNGRCVLASGWLFVATYAIFLARADSFLITTRTRYAIYLTILCALLRGRAKAPNLRLKIR